MSRRHSARLFECRKRKYDTRTDAMLALAEIVKERRTNVRRASAKGMTIKLEERAYACRCGYWHLTSSPSRAVIAYVDGRP